MQVHNLIKSSLSQARKRVGRGGKRGKTAGRGMKGQNARQGNSKRPEMRDIIKKIPKLRGHGVHGNRNKDIMKEALVVNLDLIEKHFISGDIVSPKTLTTKGLIDKTRGVSEVKILGDGELSCKITVVDCKVSRSAQEKIEKAGGSVK